VTLVEGFYLFLTFGNTHVCGGGVD